MAYCIRKQCGLDHYCSQPLLKSYLQSCDKTAVRILSATFGIKTSFVDENSTAITLYDILNKLPIMLQGDHCAIYCRKF